MSVIAAVHGVLGPYSYPQPEITEAFSAVVSPGGDKHDVIARIHEATSVQRRHLALPLEDYPGIKGFGEANDAFIRVGLDLGETAVRAALDDAGLAPADVDLVVTTSVTGLAVPSLDARLVPILGLREDVKRVPLFGLGCVAGAAGVARVHDHLVGHPDDVAVLLSVELCSLTVQRDDASMANIVASGLFGDGAAAVVVVGERRARALGLTGPTVLASRSRLYPGTERTMGWDIGESGFRIVLSADVADVVAEHLAGDVVGFLAEHDLSIDDIGTWVCHPGGPKVLQAVDAALALPPEALELSRRSLSAIGNLSSASVLHVLADTIAGHGATRPESGTPAMLLAMGPGFCAELVLLRW